MEGLQRDRKLQRQTFRYKRELRQECIPICHEDDVECRLHAPQNKDRENARSQFEICAGEQQGAAQSLCLRGVFAAAGTGLLARSFHLKALLRDRVLPPMDGGEWICRIDRSSGPIRARYRLAEADR